MSKPKSVWFNVWSMIVKIEKTNSVTQIYSWTGANIPELIHFYSRMSWAGYIRSIEFVQDLNFKLDILAIYHNSPSRNLYIFLNCRQHGPYAQNFCWLCCLAVVKTGFLKGHNFCVWPFYNHLRQLHKHLSQNLEVLSVSKS